MTSPANPAGRKPQWFFNLSRWQFALLLFVASFGVRLAVTGALRNLHQFPNPACCGADAVEFNQLALSLAAGKGYGWDGHATAFRAPGFPAFLSLVYRVSYESYFLAYLVFCALGALTCVATYYCARYLLSEPAARISAVILAIYFPHAYFSSVFLAETLAAFLLTLAMLLTIRFIWSGGAWWLIGAGLALGYCSLTRPFAFLCVPLLAVIVFWDGLRTGRKFWGALIGFGVASALVVAPWAYRNFQVYHHVVLFTTNGGSTFYGSNNDIVLHQRDHLGGWVTTVDLPGRNLIEATSDEYTHDQMEWTLGKAWVRGHLFSMPLLTLYKVIRFSLPELWSGNKIFVLAQCVTYFPLALLMLVGLYRSMKVPAFWSTPWLIVHAMILANLVTVVIFYGSARFRDCTATVEVVYAALCFGSLALPARLLKTAATRR
jgi:4-amino-4-deoxy-L-arabinose transferase-like glycosyltransferase